MENLPALLDANILGSRAINQISFRGSLAFLSCDFGIVVLDLARREIKASNTSLDATSANSPIAVYAADATGDSLFLATSQGIMAINLNDNLMDSRQYKTWGNGNGLPNIGIQPSAIFPVPEPYLCNLCLAVWFLLFSTRRWPWPLGAGF